MSDNPCHQLTQQLAEQIKDAHTNARALHIHGNGSKIFYGNEVSGEDLNVSNIAGITNYQPSELVITAFAGTPLKEINEVLADKNQMLAFEPPAYFDTATLGGTIASGFSGPRRAFTGPASDFILGSEIINGKGEVLKFGGEVIKNVAGYDVSRLMCGAFGTLGVLLQISLKVVPLPEHDTTLVFEMDKAEAINTMNELGNKPYPLSANCIYDNKLYIRLSGSEKTVTKTAGIIGGEQLQECEQFWQSIREQTHPFFNTNKNLWRVSVAPTTIDLDIAGDELIEWYGGLHWFMTDADDEGIRSAALNAGGHASLYRANDQAEHNIMQPLDKAMMRLHKNLKQAFDPANILNPGKLYTEL